MVHVRTHSSAPFLPAPLALALILAAATAGAPAQAACPAEQSNPITGGRATLHPPVVLGRFGGAPQGSYFALGHEDEHNSGTLPSSAWIRGAGDLDGDGLPEHRVEAPASGPGGWNDPLTLGCPSTLSPPRTPLAIVVQEAPEDRDGDGAFDVFEDLDRDGILDPEEDVDRDGRLTPPGGCEGGAREDLDCDGRLDYLAEDANGNGVFDPREVDFDQDGHPDPGTEDRNGNLILDDRPFPGPGDDDPYYPYGSIRPAPGGVLVAVAEWDGMDYTLDRLADETRVIETADDLDGDGALDVFEDLNHNRRLDKPVPCPGGGTICGEDRDGDGRLTPPGGCEGFLREDLDCDGFADFRDEDLNNNGRLDPGEADFDGDRRADQGTEDRNFNRFLDDRPFPDETDVIFLYAPNPDGLPFPGPIIAQLPAAYPYGRLTGGARIRVLDATPLDPDSLEAAGIKLKDGAWQIRIKLESTGRRRVLRPRTYVFEVPAVPGIAF